MDRGTGLPEDRLAELKDEIQANERIVHLSTLMDAAGNDTRMRILFLLWRNAEVRVNDLAAILELTTPAISQQLKKLRSLKIVQTRREAQTVYYRLNPENTIVECVTDFFEEFALEEA